MADEELFPPLTFDQAEEPQEEAKPEAKPETQLEPEAKVEEQLVPLAALKEARSEIKSLKAAVSRIDHLERALAQRSAQPVPDPISDPEAHSAFLLQQVQAAQANTIAEMSERFARREFGDDLVNEALEAAQQAGMIDQFRGRKDAWGDLAKWHKAEKAKAEIGDDPEAYKARLKAELLAELKSETAARSVQPPASLAGQPNLASSAPAWSGPTSLDDLLGGARKGF